jgi:hypothetical protein
MQVALESTSVELPQGKEAPRLSLGLGENRARPECDRNNPTNSAIGNPCAEPVLPMISVSALVTDDLSFPYMKSGDKHFHSQVESGSHHSEMVHLRYSIPRDV